MKTIVYYYSHKSSNRYLANKIAGDIRCDIEEIAPRLNSHLLMLMGINLGNRKLKSNVKDYDRVILCGPIWMGKLIVPLKNFVLKNRKQIRELVFVTCCGSNFGDKDKKFGHNLVFNDLRKLAGDKCIHCEAFPKSLVMPEALKDDSEAFMKTHLSDENFKGEIQVVYNRFLDRMNTTFTS